MCCAGRALGLCCFYPHPAVKPLSMKGGRTWWIISFSHLFSLSFAISTALIYTPPFPLHRIHMWISLCIASPHPQPTFYPWELKLIVVIFTNEHVLYTCCSIKYVDEISYCGSCGWTAHVKEAKGGQQFNVICQIDLGRGPVIIGAIMGEIGVFLYQLNFKDVAVVVWVDDGLLAQCVTTACTELLLCDDSSSSAIGHWPSLRVYIHLGIDTVGK